MSNSTVWLPKPKYGQLVVLQKNGGEPRGHGFPLTCNACIIGRKEEADIRVSSADVSLVHCKVLIDDDTGEATLEVHGNGTEVNGVVVDPVATVKLNHRDVFVVGGRKLRFEYLPPDYKPVAKNTPNKEQVDANGESKVVEALKAEVVDTEENGEPVTSADSDWDGGKEASDLGTAPVPSTPATKRVSFGPYLSPEQFDTDLPTATPVKRGATPRRSKRYSGLKFTRTTIEPLVEEERNSPTPDDQSSLTAIVNETLADENHAGQTENDETTTVDQSLSSEPDVNNASSMDAMSDVSNTAVVASECCSYLDEDFESTNDTATNDENAVPESADSSTAESCDGDLNNVSVGSVGQLTDEQEAHLLKTPAPATPKKVLEESTVAGRPIPQSPVADYTNVAGVKKLLQTPKPPPITPKADYTNVAGMKKLLQTPTPAADSPKADYTDVAGVKKLLQTPRPVLDTPKADYTDVAGVKKLLQTPRPVPDTPKADYTDVEGVKELLQTPAPPKADTVQTATVLSTTPAADYTDVAGVKRLMQTPRLAPQTPKADYSNVAGMKRLLRTPRGPSTPKADYTDVEGVQQLLQTPQLAAKDDQVSIDSARRPRADEPHNEVDETTPDAVQQQETAVEQPADTAPICQKVDATRTAAATDVGAIKTPRQRGRRAAVPAKVDPAVSDESKWPQERATTAQSASKVVAEAVVTEQLTETAEAVPVSSETVQHAETTGPSRLEDAVPSVAAAESEPMTQDATRAVPVATPSPRGAKRMALRNSSASGGESAEASQATPGNGGTAKTPRQRGRKAAATPKAVVEQTDVATPKRGTAESCAIVEAEGQVGLPAEEAAATRQVADAVESPNDEPEPTAKTPAPTPRRGRKTHSTARADAVAPTPERSQERPSDTIAQADPSPAAESADPATQSTSPQQTPPHSQANDSETLIAVSSASAMSSATPRSTSKSRPARVPAAAGLGDPVADAPAESTVDESTAQAVEAAGSPATAPDAEDSAGAVRHPEPTSGTDDKVHPTPDDRAPTSACGDVDTGGDSPVDAEVQAPAAAVRRGRRAAQSKPTGRAQHAEEGEDKAVEDDVAVDAQPRESRAAEEDPATPNGQWSAGVRAAAAQVSKVESPARKAVGKRAKPQSDTDESQTESPAVDEKEEEDGQVVRSTRSKRTKKEPETESVQPVVRLTRCRVPVAADEVVPQSPAKSVPASRKRTAVAAKRDEPVTSSPTLVDEKKKVPTRRGRAAAAAAKSTATERKEEPSETGQQAAEAAGDIVQTDENEEEPKEEGSTARPAKKASSKAASRKAATKKPAAKAESDGSEAEGASEPPAKKATTAAARKAAKKSTALVEMDREAPPPARNSASTRRRAATSAEDSGPSVEEREGDHEVPARLNGKRTTAKAAKTKRNAADKTETVEPDGKKPRVADETDQSEEEEDEAATTKPSAAKGKRAAAAVKKVRFDEQLGSATSNDDEQQADRTSPVRSTRSGRNGRPAGSRKVTVRLDRDPDLDTMATEYPCPPNVPVKRSRGGKSKTADEDSPAPAAAPPSPRRSRRVRN